MSGSQIVLWLVRLGGLHLVLGLLFAAAFCTRGAGRVDPAARGATWGFRVAIVPGVAVLWPLLAARWLRGGGAPPAERTSHKQAAGELRT